MPSLLWLLLTTNAWGENLFATGWGQSIQQSAEGQLMFGLFQLAGIVAVMKGLRRFYEYQHGVQTQYRPWTCFAIVIAGVGLYYSEVLMNLVYQSI